MPYSGNLLRLTQQPDARKLPPPSARHAANEYDPDPQRGEHQVPSGTGSEFQGTDYVEVVMSGGGMPLDKPDSWAITPPGGEFEATDYITYPKGNPHDSEAVLSARGAEIMACSPNGYKLRNRAHDGSRDKGFLRTLFSPLPMFTDQQHRDELYTDGLTSSVDTASGAGGDKYVRGINSLPNNNPDRVGYVNGFRQGIERVRVWDNNNRAFIDRRQGSQILQPRDVYVPNHYPRMVSTMITGPALPRDANNPDDTAMSTTSYASSPNSVIGGGF